MRLEEILTENAPKPVGPYSQAVKAGNMIFVSGQIATDPQTGEFKNASIEEETTQVMTNIKAVLQAAGADLKNIVKTDIFISDMADYAKVNEIYASFFTEKPLPARTTVAVKELPRKARIEISCIAVI